MLIGLAAVIALFTTLWLVSLALRNSSIVDIWWGPAILLVGITYFVSDDGEGSRGRLMLALVTIWALRLAVHIGARNTGTPISVNGGQSSFGPIVGGTCS